MDFLLTKLNGIFQFIPPIKLIEKCQMTPFLPFERNSSMPALAGSYKTIAKGIYRLLLSHPFPCQSSKLIGKPLMTQQALQKAVQMTTSSCPCNTIVLAAPFL